MAYHVSVTVDVCGDNRPRVGIGVGGNDLAIKDICPAVLMHDHLLPVRETSKALGVSDTLPKEQLQQA